MSTFEERYLSGRELYGDDFSPDQLEAWFRDEAEGSADLGSEVRGDQYGYHALNSRHGFRHLRPGRFKRALGVGSAFGPEYLPIIDRLDDLVIVEPSEQMVSETIGSIRPTYVKPAPSGDLPFADGEFDLVVCLGTLHHIPNVRHVLEEMGRVTEAGGQALVREPTTSMGDWRQPRPGLTRHERGIPSSMLVDLVERAGYRVDHAVPCLSPLVYRGAARVARRPVYNSSPLVLIDQVLSWLTSANQRYHSTTLRQKLRPTSLFIVGTRT